MKGSYKNYNDGQLIEPLVEDESTQSSTQSTYYTSGKYIDSKSKLRLFGLSNSSSCAVYYQASKTTVRHLYEIGTNKGGCTFSGVKQQHNSGSENKHLNWNN
ncbi:hypothetical protein [Pseudoalteromonas luteoviolacea]|uniref:Uncharacterized protein n=1 Tax=Pseudoalteromonas luteoviolacea H33 TaxID=1365251 RepID=A0A167AD62_9GAMM|nr:hypothetical protein [Pseudoalteromonas luteoviolacea]KZN45249.1 hypothetical protein N476_04360 [Pseudoalteromonas luteoviolacea H33]KZN70887.1 hypothetical protein N477_05680 [Pseudoalteromonas luteoviolacea H33-S]MBQ4877217.1 hypothetical protein [Pseudoalteromonas luteoviolacea]MBQ4906078.1 hypothetical protein [Pseudoalteromonas luteoviolacea]